MKVTRALVWSSVEWGEGRVFGEGGRAEGLSVPLYAVKMYLACDLKLKKKLLSLMIELVLILNHDENKKSRILRPSFTPSIHKNER